jgi:hypothetical protein
MWEGRYFTAKALGTLRFIFVFAFLGKTEKQKTTIQTKYHLNTYIRRWLIVCSDFFPKIRTKLLITLCLLCVLAVIFFTALGNSVVKKASPTV